MYNREKIIKIMKDITEGGKEITPYVLICQPRRVKGETPAQKLNGDNLHIDFSNFSHAFVDIYGESVDVARNYLMETALGENPKYLLFVGEDTVLPFDGFTKLHKTAEENPNSVVVGVYYTKISDSPMIMIKDENGWIKPANVDKGQVFEAYQTGMDAMLIPISILKKMKEEEPEVPFTCIANGIEDIPFVGEDNFFAHRLNVYGFKVLVNTDVQCLHMDLESGKYTAHPDVNLNHYFTNIPIGERLTLDDKVKIDKRWVDRLPNSQKK